MDEIINVPFTENEITATLGLIDISQKAAGLQVSEACVTIMHKFRQAIEDARASREREVNEPADGVQCE